MGGHACLQGTIQTQGSNLPVLCLLHWQAGSLFTTSTKWDAHYIRYIVLINKFSRKHIGLRQYTSIFLELLWVKNKERASLASYVSLCLGGNWVMAWATVTWTLSWAGGFASKLAHSLSFRGRPQHLTTWSSAQVAWEISSFPQGQWQQTGRRKPPQQVWVCHTVTSVMGNHEKWSLSPGHSEDLGSNIWREECGRHCGLS